MNNVTIKDVAIAAGVSISSVSRYINDPNSIKPIPAMRVEKAIRELGYTPNTYAQSLRREHGNTIGVVVPGLGPYFSSVCTALNDFFYRHRLLLFICDTNNEPEKERYFISALLAQRVAGLLVAHSGRNADYLRETHKQFPNMVMLDHYESDLPIDAVYEDNREDSYLLTKQVLERGCRNLLLLFRTQISTNTAQRVKGARQAVEEAGLSFEEQCIHMEDFDPDETFKVIRSFSSRKTEAGAIIAYSPLLLENTLMALNRLNLRVPHDMHLAGYALEEFLHKYRLEIPLIIQDPYEMGIRAGDALLRKLRKGGSETVKRQYCLPAKRHFV